MSHVYQRLEELQEDLARTPSLNWKVPWIWTTQYQFFNPLGEREKWIMTHDLSVTDVGGWVIS